MQKCHRGALFLTLHFFFFVLKEKEMKDKKVMTGSEKML